VNLEQLRERLDTVTTMLKHSQEEVLRYEFEKKCLDDAIIKALEVKVAKSNAVTAPIN